MDLNMEERLRKMKEMRENLANKSALPTIKKEDLALRNNKMQELEKSVKNNSLEERINNISNSINTLRESREKLLKYQNSQVEIVILIDKSGSVEGTEEIVSEGIYNMTQNEKKKNRSELITTLLFDIDTIKIHDRVPVEYADKFEYQADGGTALYDTMVTQINETKRKQSESETKPKKTIVIICTDGEDLHSKKYNCHDVRKLVKERQNEGWEFILLGANFNVKVEADRLGIKEKNAVEYDTLRLGDNFIAIENVLDDVYERGEVSDSWSKPITEHKQLSSGNDKPYTKKLLG